MMVYFVVLLKLYEFKLLNYVSSVLYNYEFKSLNYAS